MSFHFFFLTVFKGMLTLSLPHLCAPAGEMSQGRDGDPPLKKEEESVKDNLNCLFFFFF